MQTGKLISMIPIRLRRRSGKTGRLLGITEAQGRILELILVKSKDRLLSQKDVERELDLRSSMAIELLKTLEEQKMIQRVNSEHDARYKEILFTETTEHIRLALQQEIQRTEGQLVRGIPKEELDVFMRAAGKMLLNLDDQEECWSPI